jgi:Ca2+-binding RTX toxin-like protein
MGRGADDNAKLREEVMALVTTFPFEGTAEDDTIIAGADNDNLVGFAGNDSLSAGPGIDFLSGGLGDDLLDGGADIDIVNYAEAISLDGVTGITVDLTKASPQAVGADQGTDTLVNIEGVLGSGYKDVLIGDGNDNYLIGFGGDDTLKGGAGADLIIGYEGNDVLNGGQGNDTLMGGNGADTFEYSFAQTTGSKTETFKGWLADQDLPISGWSQQFFHAQYKAFLQHLVHDYDLGGKVKAIFGQMKNGNPLEFLKGGQELLSMFGDVQSVAVATGKKMHVEWYANSFTIGGGEATLTSADDHDTITDFAWGVDKLEFAGLTGITKSEFETKFTITEKDTDGNGANDSTVIALADGSWSVTLVDVVGGHSAGDTYDQIHFV